MSWEIGQILYRAKAINAATCNSDVVNFYYYKFEVVKLTPEGGWLEPVGDANYDHSKTWRKFGTWFASPTKEEALEHLKIRSKRYLDNCRRRLRDAQLRVVALEKVDNIGGASVTSITLSAGGFPIDRRFYE